MLKLLTIQEMQDIAKKRGGKCLSERYINNSTKLKWQCTDSHIWEAVPASIKQGTWCPFCARSCAKRVKLTIQEMQDIAKKRGGKCLSLNYINPASKLRWQCKNEHFWEAIPDSIRQGSWCPLCARNVKLTIQEMQDIARNRNGKCLSGQYINNHTKLKWQCEKGHIWNATPGHIKEGEWCPACRSFIPERICGQIFQRIFRTRFIKEHPPWLINQQGNRMELDGYCRKLKLAFEYQGIQHYQQSKLFKGRTIAEIKRADSLKKDLCKKKGVRLIIIPHTIKNNGLYSFIIRKLKEINEKIPRHKKFSINDLDIHSSRSLLEKMRGIAENHGGVCLSKFYIDSATKLEWRCCKGHIWEAIPTSVRMGRWCPLCARNVKLTIQEMQDIARNRNGKCLSKRYINSQTSLKWQCSKGHAWAARPSDIKLGTWCPFCAKRVKLTIQEMRDIARKRRGECLSKQYIDSQASLKWQCEKGHIWNATPGNIKQGKWCPLCAGIVKLTIQEMRDIARNRNGKCLSGQYINNHTKLKWQCADGHIWEAVPNSIKRGSWCPECAIEESKKRAAWQFNWPRSLAGKFVGS